MNEVKNETEFLIFIEKQQEMNPIFQLEIPNPEKIQFTVQIVFVPSDACYNLQNW